LAKAPEERHLYRIRFGHGNASSDRSGMGIAKNMPLPKELGTVIISPVTIKMSLLRSWRLPEFVELLLRRMKI
jgi:hypothetical protein